MIILKQYMKYDISFKCSEKMVFSKRPRQGMVFLELSGKVLFFTENMVFFPWMENGRGMTFTKKYMETWYFLFDMFHAALQKKNQRRPYPAKIHVKVIKGGHSRSTP